MHTIYVTEHDANTVCQCSMALHHSTGRQSQDEQLRFVHSRLTVELLKIFELNQSHHAWLMRSYHCRSDSSIMHLTLSELSFSVRSNVYSPFASCSISVLVTISLCSSLTHTNK